jgi:hypothetical protein
LAYRFIFCAQEENKKLQELVLAVQTEAMNWQSKHKMTLESMREMDQLIHSLKMKNENELESSEAARKVITHYKKTKIFPVQEKAVSTHVLTVSNYVELHYIPRKSHLS